MTRALVNFWLKFGLTWVAVGMFWINFGIALGRITYTNRRYS